MDPIRDLYQEVILDHGTRPRNAGPVAGADRRADGVNPLCGDRVLVELKLRADVVEEIGCRAAGCAICTAAGSTMTEAVKGRRVDDVRRLAADYHALVTGRAPSGAAALGKLAVFAGVAMFPMRVKCATLPWHALEQALATGAEAVKEPESAQGRALGADAVNEPGSGWGPALSGESEESGDDP